MITGPYRDLNVTGLHLHGNSTSDHAEASPGMQEDRAGPGPGACPATITPVRRNVPRLGDTTTMKGPGGQLMPQCGAVAHDLQGTTQLSSSGKAAPRSLYLHRRGGKQHQLAYNARSGARRRPTPEVRTGASISTRRTFPDSRRHRRTDEALPARRHCAAASGVAPITPAFTPASA